MNYKVQKYINHKKLFNIKNNKYLEIFEKLIKYSDNIECSIKFKGQIKYPCRFNLCYKNSSSGLVLAINFLNKLSYLGVRINCNLFREIFTDRLEINKIKEIIIGIDLRDNFIDSRVKIWFDINHKYKELFNKSLELHKYNNYVTSVIFKNELIFGFDFNFNGKTRIKIYPSLYKYEFLNQILLIKLKETFSFKIIQLIMKTKMVYITFDKNYNRHINFQTDEINYFLNLIKNKDLNRLIKILNNNKLYKYDYFFGIKEKDINNNNNINNFNFYY